jgi:hypothetical protein
MAIVTPALLEATWEGGTLRVSRGGVSRQFALRAGYLVAECSNQPDEHLAQVLANLRMLSPQQAASAFEAAEAMGEPLGSYLVQLGLLSREQLVKALEHKARAALFDCYLWESGELEFTASVPPITGVELRLELWPLHHEAVRRAEEYRAIHPRPDGNSIVAAELLQHARKALDSGQYAEATRLLEEAMAKGPIPEAQALYRQAETKLRKSLREELLGLEERLSVQVVSDHPPAQLSVDDWYWYSKLRSSMRGVFRTLATKELAAFRSVQSLIRAGLLRAKVDAKDISR